MNRFFGLPLLIAAFVLITACATTDTGKSAGTDKDKTTNGKATFGLSISTQDNPFFVSLREGAEKAAKEAGAELIVVDAKNDTEKQSNDMDGLTQKKVDVLLINPTDSNAIVKAVESANAAGIPIITIDRVSNGGVVISHIGSDNVKGGQMAGDFILQAIGNKGNIVELQGLTGTSSAVDRGKGFHKAVDGKAGVKVNASKPADFDKDQGMSVMKNMLQTSGNIKAVFAHNDEMALGAIEAIAASGKKDIIVVGFDASADALSAINAGTLSATVAQKPEEMGRKAIEAAVNVAAGKSVAVEIPVELELITKQQ